MSATESKTEYIQWLIDYKQLVGDDRFFEFVADKQTFMNERCKKYRKMLAELGTVINEKDNHI